MSTPVTFNQMKSFHNNPNYTSITTSNINVITTTGSSVNLTGTLLCKNGNGATSFNNNQIIFGSNNAHAIKTRHDSNNNANNSIDFYTWQTSDSSSTVGSRYLMSITGTGIGIGTTSTNNQITIRGLSPQIHIQNSTSGSEASICFASNTNWFMGTNINGIGSANFGITIAGANLLTMNTSGNVGVNYNNPRNTKLRIAGANPISIDYSNYILVSPESAWTSNRLIGTYWDGTLGDTTAIFTPGLSANAGTAKILLSSSGINYANCSVGVGTNAPAYALDAGSGGIISDYWMRSRNVGGIYNETHGGGWYMEDYTWLRTWGKSIWTDTGYICNNTNARFGAGTSGPQYPFHVASGGGYPGWQWYGYLGYNGTGTAYDNPYTSVYCVQRILASEFNATSDTRIKTNITDIDDNYALNILRQIQPKRYNYIDNITRSDKPVWGFIAQQIEEVLPYAVTTTRDFIPNIFELSTFSKDNNDVYKITLSSKTTDLLTSDPNVITPVIIQLYINNKGHTKEVTLKEIIDEHSFTINESLSEVDPVTENGITEHRVFVHGVKVSNFKNLNKDAIFTVATAALQQVDRELQTTKQKLSTIKTKISNRQILIDSLKNKMQQLTTN